VGLELVASDRAAALRSRFLACHDPSRVALAERVGTFRAAAAVYELAGARREAAERELEAALEALEAARVTEADWGAVCHGLALALARDIEKAEKSIIPNG